MPTYEKCDADGTVLERTVTLEAGHPSGYDEQMAALADDDSIPWHLVADFPAEAHSDPNPALITPATDGVPTRAPRLDSESGSANTPEV